jgi:pimeloyl-ACP methyl ester carboxylesterase
MSPWPAPTSSVSARGVVRRLVSALPRVELLEFDELGHMGPITRPDTVNEAIAKFLKRV